MVYSDVTFLLIKTHSQFFEIDLKIWLISGETKFNTSQTTIQLNIQFITLHFAVCRA